MRCRGRWIASVCTGAVLLSACGQAVSDEEVIDEPAIIEPVEGTEVARVALTARGAERLGIRTAPVEEAGNRMVVPSAAVLVDPNGDFWVYTSPKPLHFLRREISIVHEAGERTFLAAGPSPGTNVVTVGVAELYGAESGIGH
jgi:hypothetical protein